jgi:DNA-binding MarR family transcriptional regulator
MMVIMAEDARQSRTVLNRHTYVPHYVMITANALAAGASRLYRNHFDLGINEGRITAVLGHEPDRTALEIGNAVAMNKSIISRSLHTLLERGLVSQSGGGRGRRYRLTEAGERVHDAVVRMSLDREALLLQGIDDAERSTLLRLLGRMLDNVTEMNSYVPVIAKTRPVE